MNDAQSFFNALRPAILKLIRAETRACLKCAAYTVSSPYSGGRLGVRLNSGGSELFVPCSSELQSAVPGDGAILLWQGSLSNAYAVAPR